MMKYSIYDTQTNRHALNLLENTLVEAVRPWFKGINDANVTAAIDALANPEMRGEAAQYLGITLVPCA
ncbi:hypothetical protein NXS08_02145 [Gleimia sp. 6138-11-ORH1]|uniref:hypothetical protein n=1 Tax=Gleimia sp. 6138-11-ORH1 TaxID=2973937 RepID=UPI002168FFC3|nr:hypothetical protein [Gleimia sp. 6138-11-ORH1]MCS4484292.1 hypothetical protein [Gleimia sp. 6138-11-ORH1]